MLKRALFIAALVILSLGFQNAEATERNSASHLKQMLISSGFIALPQTEIGRGFTVQKFYRQEAILAVNFLQNFSGELAGVSFEFEDDAPRGALINFMNEVLCQSKYLENIDLLSGLTTTRREKGGYEFSCGKIGGSVAYGSFFYVPLRRIEFHRR